MGGDYIYTTLSADAGVTALVGTTHIHNARMVPETDTSKDTINFYQVTPWNVAQEYFDITWSIDCRSEIQSTSEATARAVSDALNRESATVGGKDYYGVAEIFPAIPPADQADVYNTPVQIRLRRRR